MPEYQKRYTDLSERGPDIFVALARPVTVKVTPELDCVDLVESVRAIIDTGATTCAILCSLADKLGLQPFDRREYGNSMGREECPVYLADVILPGDDGRHTIEVVGCEFGDPQIEFLLGRNFLERGSFHYDGTLGSYTLRW